LSATFYENQRFLETEEELNEVDRLQGIFMALVLYLSFPLFINEAAKN
jgi:hypothetical protein